MEHWYTIPSTLDDFHPVAQLDWPQLEIKVYVVYNIMIYDGIYHLLRQKLVNNTDFVFIGSVVG